jgi:hypothetical protein
MCDLSSPCDEPKMPVSNPDSSLYPVLSTFLSNLSNKTSLPILHINAIPHETLAASIAEDLCKSRIELSELDLEIYEWERRLKWLREWRERCRDAIRRHEAVLSPVRRLPIELISQIMLSALSISRPSFREDGRPINRHDDYCCAKNEWGVQSLALVCTDWREAAVTCPRIWSHILFCPKYSTPEQLQMYINHAGSVPLTFTQCEVYAHHGRRNTHREEIKELSKAQIICISSSSTWTSASLYIDIDDANSVEYALCLKGKLQSLQHLILHIVDVQTAQSPRWSLVPDLLKEVHSLVNLELSSDTSFNFNLKSVTTSLQSLRSLTFRPGIENFQPDDLGPVLESCSSLESLTLGDNFNIQRPVCLPSLRDLTLLKLSLGTIPRISHLRLPLLESLSVVHFGDELFQFALVAPFINWRSEALRRLKLVHSIPDWFASTEEAFLRLVKQLPDIDTLQVVSYS